MRTCWRELAMTCATRDCIKSYRITTESRRVRPCWKQPMWIGLNILYLKRTKDNSQSSGEAWSAVRYRQEQTRTMQLAMMHRLNRMMKRLHSIVQWLVGHADSLNYRHTLGTHMMSAHRKVTWRDFKRTEVEFGECVLCKKLGDTWRRVCEDMLDTGVMLGMYEDSNESIIGARSGVVVAMLIRRAAHE